MSGRTRPRPLSGSFPPAAFVVISLTLLACRNPGPEFEQRSEPLQRQAVPEASEADVRPIDGHAYSRSLADQLDWVPAGADYLVVRDLRPLLDQAHAIEKVLGGPLDRALLGLGDGLAGELEDLRGARADLALLLAGLEGAGVALDRGAVLSELDDELLLSFAATDLDKLALAADLADPGLDLARDCARAEVGSDWWTCSAGGPSVLARYRPGHRGERMVADMRSGLPGVDLERVNVALQSTSSSGAAPFVMVLRTDPGLWEASAALPGGDALRAGPAPALRSFDAGAGFLWARVDPLRLLEASPIPIDAKALTGEVVVGPLAEPDALVARVGVSDIGQAAQLIQQVASLLPTGTFEPEGLGEVEFDIDRRPIDLGGVLVPSLGFTGRGGELDAIGKALGIQTHARAWAYGDYLSIALGDSESAPTLLEGQTGSGPSPSFAASLPPTLAAALIDRQVGLAIHLALDPWQAPLSDEEVGELVAELGGSPNSDPGTALRGVFAALAPWSSASVWLARGGATDPWVLHVSLVPFVNPAVPADELEATRTVLATALADGDAQTGYADLLARFPTSPRAAAWRARAGQAPESYLAIGLMQVGILVGIAMPALEQYSERAKANEAEAETKAIMAAALDVHERAGSCKSLIGRAGPTPALALACHAREGGRCRPGEPDYPASDWTNDPIWSAIAWQPSQGHRFHYSIETAMSGKACTITVQAQGDLDGDGEFSSYTRRTTIEADGTRVTPNLEIVGEGE